MPKDNLCTKDTPVSLGLPQTPIYGKGVIIRPRVPGKQSTPYERKSYLPELLPLEEYDLIIVLLSGGKDSIACYLRLLELGVPKSKIRFWHHDVDGGHPERRMDWPVTQNYVRALADAEGVALQVSWRINGFWGEVFRVGASFPVQYEEGGEIQMCPLTENQLRSHELRTLLLNEPIKSDYEKLKGFGYRMKFPAKAADLERRWCSSTLKISVADKLLRNIEELSHRGSPMGLPHKATIENGRWCSAQLKRTVGDQLIRNLEELRQMGYRLTLPGKGSCQQGRWCSGILKASVEGAVTSGLESTARNVQILVVSGERRAESAPRSHYNEIELHRTNAAKRAHRLVHQWRAVIDHNENDIWTMLRRHHITPHPCYQAGWNRCSCMMCIFSSPSHWAGIRELFPNDYYAFCEVERQLGFTLDAKRDLETFVGSAKSCVSHDNPTAIKQLITGGFECSDIYTPSIRWEYPAGAFHGAAGGPC